MQLGMIGLGRMGGNMVVRLARAGHEVVGYARDQKNVKDVIDRSGGKAVGSTDSIDLVKKLKTPRNVWLMLPAAVVDSEIQKLLPHLEKGDTLIDGGNSCYIDDIRRAKELAPRGIHYLDVGTSGGVWGLERGYCMMIGGDKEAVQRMDPIFKTLAPGQGSTPPSKVHPMDASCNQDKAKWVEAQGTSVHGYLHCGPAGAGHFVKMVHNGIEYALMAAYGEGFNILKHANIGKKKQGEASAEETPLRNPENYQYDFNLQEIAELWRRGSVVASWLLDLTAEAFLETKELPKEQITVFGDAQHKAHGVPDSGEGRWTLLAAIDEGVPCTLLSASLYSRFTSRKAEDFSWKVAQAMRRKFGGH
jgi:6-phosphogluconate dehydrogenase